MGPCAPGDNYKRIFTNMKIKQTNLRYTKKHIQGINPMGLVDPWLTFSQHLPTQLKTWITRGTYLETINVLMVTREITKTSTLSTNFHNPVGEANPYVQFRYIPLTILNHTGGQVSGSMNADPIDMIHTIQQPNK